MARRRWLVDGMNVIGTRPDGWWRDRPNAMQGLVEQLAAFAAGSADDVTVVFDAGAARAAARVDVVIAPRRGRDAADDEIARRVGSDGDPASIRVVTSDRALASRVRAAGADVVGASEFRRLLDDDGGARG